MFGNLFSTGQPAEVEATTPAADPVIALPAPCCEHCRLQTAVRREPRISDYAEPASSRIRFDDAFEAEGRRLRDLDRQADTRLQTLNTTVGQLERQVWRLQQMGQHQGMSLPSSHRPSTDSLVAQIHSYENELKMARGQQAYALKTWRETRAALNAHSEERRAREDLLAAQQIAERNRRRAAEREAAGIPPPDTEVDRSAPPLVLSRSKMQEITRGLHGTVATTV